MALEASVKLLIAGFIEQRAVNGSEFIERSLHCSLVVTFLSRPVNC